MTTAYQTLGITPAATQVEVRDAYWALARIHHPDAGGDTGAFTELVLAYNLLIEKKSRKNYDKKLDLTMKKCSKCEGIGLVYSARNVPSKCKACQGAAYVSK